MDRRALIGSLVSGILAVALGARAQPVRKVPRIGILNQPPTSSMVGPQPQQPSVNAFLQGLRELGYVYGEHFVTEPHGADGRPERFPNLAAELVRLQVDVIVAVGVALGAVKAATSTIPVVMVGSDDPVGRGHVRSLARPGTNFTGLSTQQVETTGKRLELLKALVPADAPVAVLWDQASRPSWQAAQEAARARGWKLLSLEIRDAGEVEEAFRAATRARAGAILVAAIRFTASQAPRVAEIAARSQLPAMYDFRFYVEAGGLVSYGPDTKDLWRRAAFYVDRILRGAKPGDIPVEQASKFELVINLKTAKALGLPIPPLVLLQADELIQ